MKLVFLDRKSIGEDIDFSPFHALGDVDIYSFTTPGEVPERIKDADVIIVNKIPVNEQTILLNLGRGPIINEAALAAALKEHKIAAAGLDVLAEEPMSKSSPLVEVLDYENLLITPHIAWASIEARTRLMKITEGHIKEFFRR